MSSRGCPEIVVAALWALALLPAGAGASQLILNEFNAVSSSNYLNFGSAGADGDGNSTNPPSDPFFGRIAGNGGDWFELVVVADHLDIRGWKLDICEGGLCNDQLVFSNNLLWSDLRAGTILTIAEDVPTDLSFNPGGGDWWINVQATNGGPSTYISASNFPVSNNDWQLIVRDGSDNLIFGPAGEHVAPSPGCTPPGDDVNSGEIFRLEQPPSALIDPCLVSLNDWEDGVLSTFGAPNLWNSSTAVQSFDHLRSNAPLPDRDGDQVPDDGDLSGVAGDFFCPDGVTSACDDNCPGKQNPNQLDGSGAGGMGNACQCGDPSGDDQVTATDLLEIREYLAGQLPMLTAPERCSVHSDRQCNAVDVVVLARTLADAGSAPGISRSCRAAYVPPDQSELMFDPDRIVKVDVRIALDDWNLLRVQANDIFSLIFGPDCGNAPWNDPYTFFSAEVTVDGQVVSNVGVRKKGFQGSLSETMPSLKVKFDHYVGGQQVNDMDRLTLNNNKQDPAQIKQCLAYALMREAGIPAPRCNFAHVTVTTVDGPTEATAVDRIYTHVDSIKDPLLRRNFGSDQGRLYEGTLSDFWAGSFRNTIEPKTPEAAEDTSEIDALTSVLMDGGLSDAARLSAIQGLVDVDDFLTFWAGEGMIGHWDGYGDDQNNYYFYVDPSDDLIRFIPWGADDTFGKGNPLRGGEPVHAEAIVPRSALVRRLYEIPSTRDQFLARLQLLMDTVWDETAIHAEIDRMEALISPIAGNLTSELAPIRTWVDDHRAEVAAELASPPTGFPGQPNHFCIQNP